MSRKNLVVHIEIPGVFVDDLPSYVESVLGGEEATPAEVADIVAGEWLQAEVGVTLLAIPDDSGTQMGAFVGQLVGVEFREAADQ